MIQILQATQASGSSWTGILMIVLVFVVMWFFMIRPQRKQQKALEQMRSALKKGDKVITAGGIYGVVADIDDKSVVIKVDGEVKLRVDKSSIQADMSDVKPAEGGKK